MRSVTRNMADDRVPLNIIGACVYTAARSNGIKKK
jgi:hypothetical protein